MMTEQSSIEDKPYTTEAQQSGNHGFRNDHLNSNVSIPFVFNIEKRIRINGLIIQGDIAVMYICLKLLNRRAVGTDH